MKKFIVEASIGFKEATRYNEFEFKDSVTDKEIQEDDKKRYLIHPIDAISYPIYFMQTFKDMTNY